MQKSLIVALDFPGREEVLRFLSQFGKEKLYVKVGMELFYQEGPGIVEYLVAEGHDVFLDLKLHDIPHTVYQAMKGLGKLGVTMTNLHAAGGKEMMKAGLEGLMEGAGERRPNLIAVTQLTSMTEKRMQKDLKISASLDEVVLHYARNAFESGLDGVVCSSLEATMLRDALGAEFKKVTPGIRLKEDSVDDQKRVVTPMEARKFGATEIVVGRSITRANDPRKAYEAILQQWQGVEIG
ncbi:orotidine 5'-phosphate decarboxylase [Sutcliffiella horikoshii]|uniref:Orotidine 5'-phosphate decarboxylase n=1 Tax=Sutcliffiella horikoshii TaxID=79883 RepID=A0ABN4ZDG4_9BACI|nr:orotidine-5'-phosphate decarboxylase [Sutcliffiella horikoshii]ART76285.1 orotidine 5'-phosphate decarboxylase [Sutcliffiella horikoshii]